MKVCNNLYHQQQHMEVLFSYVVYFCDISWCVDTWLPMIFYLKWEWRITILPASHSGWHPGNINCLVLLKYEWIVLNIRHSDYFSRCVPFPRLHCLHNLFESSCQYPDSIQKTTQFRTYPCETFQKCLFSAAASPPPLSCRIPKPVLAWNVSVWLYPMISRDIWTLSWEFLKIKLKVHKA